MNSVAFPVPASSFLTESRHCSDVLLPPHLKGPGGRPIGLGESRFLFQQLVLVQARDIKVVSGA